MLPFSIDLTPGQPIADQLVYAVRKAIVSGQLREGDPFPSVRSLSQALRINPNTAHKAVASLIDDGLLVVLPGIGTRVAKPQEPSPEELRDLMERRIESLVVEARRLGVDRRELTSTIESTWETLDKTSDPRGSAPSAASDAEEPQKIA